MKTNFLRILNLKSIATILVASLCVCNSHAMYCNGSPDETPTLDFLPIPLSTEGNEEFEDLPNPYSPDTANPNYDARRDRYSNIYSIPNEYTTKNGREVNAAEVIKISETEENPAFSLIATQAPKQETFDDYLDLLFSNDDTDGVVVLGPVTASNTTWERRGIPPYFMPNSPITLAHNEDSSALYTCEAINADETLSEKINGVHKYTLKITSKKTGKEKTINLHHFSDWPDKEIPTNTEDFKKFVNMFTGNRELVVHCSAGIGRTGVFAAYLQAIKTGNHNAFRIVDELRQHRVGMVQTKQQFEFLQELLK